MTIEKMTGLVWDMDLQVPAWKLVLLAIVHDAMIDIHGDFWDEDVMHIARMTSLSPVGVENAIKALESKGILERCGEPCPEVFHVFLRPLSKPGLKTPRNVAQSVQ